MQITRIAPIGLLALAIMIPSARAQNNQISVKLVQTSKLITSPHPGVNADILGVHIGMTVSQAEAIAAKSYPGKPKETEHPPEFAVYRGIYANSQSFVGSVVFGNPNTGDSLTLYFSSPATGNVVYAMYRDIRPPDPLSAPLYSAVKASVIKKYGPFSYHESWPAPEDEYIWQFGKQSLEHCAPPAGGVTVACDVESLQDGDPGEAGEAFGRSGVAMGIFAQIVSSNADGTKLGALDVTIEDYQDQNNSINVTTKQLNNAAIKYYNKAAKAPGVKL
ncbi:MAG: hypothetical protein ACYCOR_01225 [Acidobacteriaceae bacterium]